MAQDDLDRDDQELPGSQPGSTDERGYADDEGDEEFEDAEELDDDD